MWSRPDENQFAQAIARGDFEKVKELIGRVDLSVCAENGTTSFLHLAAMRPNPEILDFLLETLKKYDPKTFHKLLNIRNNFGTPLHVACKAKKRENILLLLQYKPLTYLPDKQDKTFFDFLTADEPIITFGDLSDDIKPYVLKEHRYHILLNRHKKELMEYHQKWAQDVGIKLKDRVREQLWLRRETLTDRELKQVYSDSSAQSETFFRVRSLPIYLEKRLAKMSGRYVQRSLFSLVLRNVLGDSLVDLLEQYFISALRFLKLENFIPAPSQAKYNSLKWEIIIKLGMTALMVLVFFPSFALGAFMVGSMIGGPGAGLIAAAITIGLTGWYFYGIVKDVIPDIKELTSQPDQLSETIDEALPDAKELLKQLQRLNDNNFQDDQEKLKQDIEALSACISMLEQGVNPLNESDLIDRLTELKTIAANNVKYVEIEAIEEESSLQADIHITQEESPTDVVIEIPDDKFESMMRDLPRVTGNQSGFHTPRYRETEDAIEMTPLLERQGLGLLH